MVRRHCRQLAPAGRAENGWSRVLLKSASCRKSAISANVMGDHALIILAIDARSHDFYL